MNYLEELLDL